MASLGTAILSVGTILGCLLAAGAGRAHRAQEQPWRFISAGMAVAIALAFGWAFYLPDGLRPFLVILFFLGLAGGNFAMFSLWLPEQYHHRDPRHRFCLLHLVRPLSGRGRQFRHRRADPVVRLAGPVIALTAIPFVIGLAVIPFALETKGKPLP